MERVGVISGWTIYEDEGSYYVRYEQVVGSVAKAEPSVAKAILDFVLRRDIGEGE